MTKHSLSLIASAGLSLCLGLAAGCNKSSSGGASPGGATPAAQPVKLAFVTNNTSEFWKIAGAGIHKYEKEGKVQVDLKLPASGTTEAQNQILQDLASQGYAGIAVSAIAPNDQVALLDKIAEKTNLITVDSDAPKSTRLLYIGTNNHDAGKALGERIVQLLPKGGKIAVFVGTFAAENAAQRLKGIEDAIAGHNIEIVDKREDNTDRAKARSNVEDIINAHHDLALVVGLYNYNGPAIAAALDGLGKKGKVLAAVFDEDDGTLDGIENGAIQATVVQKPFMFGYLASKWMHDLATKGEAAKAAIPASKTLDTGVDVIDKTNVGAFKAKLAELKRS
ncbi:MAG TPA: sugar-binding protein [Polyangia bacterium]|nr:sugar-binding protein [Polyangia bacterium]